MEQGENQSVNVTFHAGEVPVAYKLDYEPCLFNTQAYRLLQAKDGWREFHFLHPEKKIVLVSVYFHVLDDVARSPLRAPFGGFEYSNTATPAMLFGFIKLTEEAFRKSNVNTIEILCPCELYSNAQSFVTIGLLNRGFQNVEAEPGACILVDEIPLQEKMSKDKRARLRQCVKAGLTFKEINLNKLEEVYRFISTCRMEQGRTLSMTFSELATTVERLPQSFFTVGVFDDKHMIGACICVRVRSNVVYTFYSAHDSQYDAISPRVFLLSNLYDWSLKNKISILDLGTSALDGKPNFPLLDFKMRVGATLTPKYKFRKTLA